MSSTTRTRKVTLTVKEFSHLVSESLDITHVAPAPQSFVDYIPVASESPPKTHPRQSSFQRIFSRPTPTPGHHADTSQGPPEDLFDTPRKMIAWPFSRSPRKNRPTKDEDYLTHQLDDPERSHAVSPYSVSSLAAASTSSLGSLVPVHERLFQVASGEFDGLTDQNSGHVFKVSGASPPLPCTSSECSAAANFGNGSTSSVLASTTTESASEISSQGRTSFEGTEAPSSVTTTEPESLDEDPTPRASTFGSRVTLRPAATQDEQRGRPQHLSVVVPSRKPSVEILALRPAVGVAPHAPSEESPTSAYSTSSPTSPVARGSSPTFPSVKLSESDTSPPVPRTPPNPRIFTVASGVTSPSNLESPPLAFCPRQRKRAMSRSLTPPPLPRPPPTGPLPAVPSSIPPVPPVPPLPPLLSKISMNLIANPHSVVSSPPRPVISGAQTNPATALPPSPPGGLRLPSRLSWVNTVRAVLPSPPASPTKSIKSLTGKTPLPISPSKAEIKRPNELKRPTSIGVIEAADNVQVRRTKSILLLGSRSKSNASLGTKRVQIHADANLEAAAAKPRRKSSAATVGHPIFSSEPGPATTTMQGSELLVPRERRHSAPVLSTLDSKAAGPSADWTLSLPFCTDTPGNKLQPSPLMTPTLTPEPCMEEDWTLCMPLKVRVDTPTVESAEGPESECTLADTVEEVEMRPAVQLPTPSPSPTWPSPASVVRPLDPEEDESVTEERSPSRASLGPHAGGLDLAGGRGKRASGWHVYGWFDEVCLPENERADDHDTSEDDHEDEDTAPTSPAVSESKFVKSHVSVFRKIHDGTGRHPSQDSTSTVSTSSATFYSAHSCLMVN